MSSDELQKRVSAQLDAEGGLAASDELSAAVAADPELQRFVSDAGRLDALLRTWPLEEISDDAWEAMAARVDQRLDDALSAIGDVTRPPAFDDDDARRDPSGATAVQDPKKPAFSIDRLSDLESTEELSMPHLPPPTPKVVPLTSPKPSRRDERLEIPTVQPLLQPLQPMGPLSLPPSKSSKNGWIAFGGFAAAAAVLVVFGLYMNKGTQSDSEDTVALNEQAPADYRVGGSEAEGRERDVVNLPAVAAPALSNGDAVAPRATAAAPATPSAVTEQQRGAPPADALYAARAGEGSTVARTTANEPAEVLGGLADETGSREPRQESAPARADDALRAREGTNLEAIAANQAAPEAPPPAAAAMPAATHTAGGGRAQADRAPATTPPAPRAATRPASGAASAGADDGDLPATPEQSEVRSALESVRSAVTACAAGQHGLANIRVTFSGSSGRVSNVNVEGVFAGTPLGSCMARAVRAARVPHFSDPSLVVLYPYAL